jgi:hypothetical protein
MYSRALEVGILPSEFWEMSLHEIKSTVDSRIRQKNNEIYALSSMIRIAVLSAFSKDVQFPAPPSDQSEDKGINWENSKNYMKALQKIHNKGGAK